MTHEVLSRGKRRGAKLQTGTATLSRDTYTIRVRSRIAPADKKDGNTFAQNVYTSYDGGTTWRFAGGDAYNTLAPKPDKKNGGTKERGVGMTLERDRVDQRGNPLPPFPAGTMVKVEIDAPNEMDFSVEIED